MALPKRKIEPQPEAAAPQFHVVPKPEAAPPVKKGGLNLGGLIKKGSDKKTAEKPRIANPSVDLVETLAEFAKLKPQLTALEGTVKGLSARAGQLAKPEWFKYWQGRGDAGSTMVVDVGGSDVQIIFKNAYSKKGDPAALDALGLSEHFTTATTLKIEMEKIPEEKRQDLVEAILAAAAELGIVDGISATEAVVPKPGVHASRHVLFTPEQNIAIDNIVPITAYPKL